MTPGVDGRDAGLSPDEAFGLLGNETRVGILRALWRAFESGTGENAVPFSTLYEDVDIADTGNFTYHLEKLTGPFVRRTDDGYALKQTGINVVRAVVAGSVTEDPAFGPTAVDADCPRCGAPVEVEYADELMTVYCTACAGGHPWRGKPGFVFGGLVPSAVMEGRSVEAAFRAGVTYTSLQIAALREGVCPHCSGVPDVDIEVCADHEYGEEPFCPNCGRYHPTEAWLVCSMCKRSVYPPVSVVVLADPEVAAFYGARGVDHRIGTWEATRRAYRAQERLVGEEPFRLAVTFPAEDDELRLVYDEALTVRDSSR